MFYEKLKEERLKLNLEQIDLAKAMNVSKTTIQNWEKGISMPDMDNAIKLSEVLDVSLDYLLKDNKSNSDFSYYTIHQVDHRKIDNRYHAAAFVFLVLSLMVIITLFIISFIEPITYETANHTFTGFLAYCLSSTGFLTLLVLMVIVLILGIIALILPEEKLRNIFKKKNVKKQ